MTEEGARKWPTKDPSDRKHITEGTLVWDSRVKLVKVARRCVGCKRLYLVPWDRLNAERPTRCAPCRKSGR